MRSQACPHHHWADRYASVIMPWWYIERAATFLLQVPYATSQTIANQDITPAILLSDRPTTRDARTSSISAKQLQILIQSTLSDRIPLSLSRLIIIITSHLLSPRINEPLSEMANAISAFGFCYFDMLLTRSIEKENDDLSLYSGFFLAGTSSVF